MIIERYDLPISPWDHTATSDFGNWCRSADVARLEASHAELESKCAELQRLLDSYTEAFDVINDSMTWAHRIIADPDSITVIDLPTESMVAKNAELLAALKLFIQYNEEGAPLSFPIDEMWAKARAAIAKAEGDQP